MSFFCITDKQHDITMGKFASAETALMDAITKARVAGERSLSLRFDAYTATVEAGSNGAVLFTVQPIPTGGKPGPKPREKVEKPSDNTALRFPGKPPKDGWYSCTTCELDTAEALRMLEPLMVKETQHVLCFMAAGSNNPIKGALFMEDMLAKASMKELPVGGSTSIDAVAKVEASKMLTDLNIPAEAIAVYLLQLRRPKRNAFSKATGGLATIRAIAKQKVNV